MIFKIEAKSILTLEHKEGQKTSKHISTDFNLNTSTNISEESYFNDDELPNKDGVKCLTHCFIHGLIGNVHYAHSKGYWKDSEHLRFIISELEKLFIEIPNIYISEFDK